MQDREYVSFQTSVITMTYLAVDHMSKDKGGSGGIIVNISSVAGQSFNFCFCFNFFFYNFFFLFNFFYTGVQIRFTIWSPFVILLISQLTMPSINSIYILQHTDYTVR